MTKRYCEGCDEWVRGKECPACGMPTQKPLPPASATQAPYESPNQKLADAAEMLWVVLANVSGGDWTKQTPEWQDAAARFRDKYFAALKAASRATSAPQKQKP